MTRRHYKLLAAAFKRKRQEIQQEALTKEERPLLNQLLEDIEDEVCLVLQEENPSFNHHLFTTASGRTE